MNALLFKVLARLMLPVKINYRDMSVNVYKDSLQNQMLKFYANKLM